MPRPKPRLTEAESRGMVPGHCEILKASQMSLSVLKTTGLNFKFYLVLQDLSFLKSLSRTLRNTTLQYHTWGQMCFTVQKSSCIPCVCVCVCGCVCARTRAHALQCIKICNALRRVCSSTHNQTY